MSSGLVVCSACKREVHQKRIDKLPPPGTERTGEKELVWYHCEGETIICEHATAVAPASLADVVGNYCGADDHRLASRMRVKETETGRIRPAIPGDQHTMSDRSYVVGEAGNLVRVRPERKLSPSKQRRKEQRAAALQALRTSQRR